MKKKRILTAAVNACVSLALFLNLFNVGVLGSVYAESEDNAERSNGELNEAKVNYGDEESRYILLNQTETAENVIRNGEWFYFDKGDHISVCGYSGNEEHITIPSEIDGKKVTELSYVGENEFSSPCRFFDPDNSSEVEVIELTTDHITDSEPKTKHITIPETVTRIGERTFYECPCLERVDMSEGLISIGNGAFEFCEQLKNAEIPSSLKTIEDSAFSFTSITSLSLPEGLEYIGYHAFFATNIKQLEIPDTVKYIGFGAFSWCRALESVKLPKDITVISEDLFSGCHNLRSVEIPEGVQVIGEGAFGGCSNLESIYIPSTVNVLSGILSENPSLKDIYYAADKETANAMTGSDILSSILYGRTHAGDDYATDYSKIQIHYAEKTETPTENTEEDNIVKIIFSVLAITFSVTLIAALCLYIVQKIKNRPKPAPLAASVRLAASVWQGNVLTSFNSSTDTKICKGCKTANGENAKYCYACGKKLTAKPPKGSEKEQSKI